MTTPTDWRVLCKELVEAYEWCINRYMTAPSNKDALVYRARAALAQPEPQGATDERITSIAKAVQECARAWSPNARLLGNVRADDIDDLCNAVLARWGRPAIEPVPVSERLPGPEDCAPWPGEPDATHWAWAAKCVDGGWEWTQISMQGLGSADSLRIIAGGGWTHWLPHNALPIPTP